tara:strand:- start:41 stop:241 length:201 start_codon:yes stop_codon:yes gene_type:complete
MTKEEIIAKLTLQDTQAFRLKAKRETGVYKKEPKGFRKELASTYSKLYSLETLEKLLEWREAILEE